MRKVITKTPEETFGFAKEIGQKLKKGCTIALDGDLGAGKTVFVQGLAVGLGIEKPIVSPTFNIVRQYSGRLPFHHFDVYRIEDPDELYEIGFSEYLGNGQVTVIEWAEKISDILPTDTVYVRISGAGDDPREIIMTHEEGLAI